MGYREEGRRGRFGARASAESVLEVAWFEAFDP